MPPYGGILRLFGVPRRVLDAQLIGNILDSQAELAFRPARVASKCFFSDFRRKPRKIHDNRNLPPALASGLGGLKSGKSLKLQTMTRSARTFRPYARSRCHHSATKFKNMWKDASGAHRANLCREPRDFTRSGILVNHVFLRGTHHLGLR